MTFSQRTMDSIHECLSRAGITQRDLAAEMHCTEAWVSMILKPGFNTTLKTIDRIEAALHQILIKRAEFNILPAVPVDHGCG